MRRLFGALVIALLACEAFAAKARTQPHTDLASAYDDAARQLADATDADMLGQIYPGYDPVTHETPSWPVLDGKAACTLVDPQPFRVAVKREGEPVQVVLTRRQRNCDFLTASAEDVSVVGARDGHLARLLYWPDFAQAEVAHEFGMGLPLSVDDVTSFLVFTNRYVNGTEVNTTYDLTLLEGDVFDKIMSLDTGGRGVPCRDDALHAGGVDQLPVAPEMTTVSATARCASMKVAGGGIEIDSMLLKACPTTDKNSVPAWCGHREVVEHYAWNGKVLSLQSSQ